MKRNDLKTLHEQTPAQLGEKLSTLKLELAKAKLELKAGKLSNTSLLKTLRADIARVKTILKENQ